MNDSIAFLALATIFGMAMLIVGWSLRQVREEQEVRSSLASWVRDYPDDADAAGA
jgi:uncharacterized membrane protein